MADPGAQKSTTVRAETERRAARRAARRRTARRRRALARFAVVRARLAVLQRVAPARAARSALDLWCTPPDGAGRRRDDRHSPGRSATVTTGAGARVVVETWEPAPGAAPGGEPVGVVHLVHGWGGWRGQLGAFVEPLRAAGFRVVAADAPSHGDSGPGALGARRSTLPEMADALAAVARAHGEPSAVVAHSLGTAAAALAVRDGLAVGRLVLVAPIADPLGELDAFAEALRLAPPTRDLLRARLAVAAGRPLDDMDVLDTARGRPVPPALVVHDRADKEVPYRVGAEIAASWPEGELLTTEGLGHHRLLRDATVVRAVVDYLVPVAVPGSPESGVGDAA